MADAQGQRKRLVGDNCQETSFRCNNEDLLTVRELVGEIEGITNAR